MTVPRTFLVAPDSFKGSLAAPEVAAAIAAGLEEAGYPVDVCPVADGGEGTLEVLVAALKGETMNATVSDPLGRPVEASFGICRDGARTVAIVEAAGASGLGLLSADELDPVAASTYGTGELIAAAAQAGAEMIYLGVGGSATTDGGAGAIRAIREAGDVSGVRLAVLCDVRTPFERAAAVFGPQKGASPDEVKRLTARLNRQARTMPRDPRGIAMTGAAGGLSGGLWAELGAELVPGAPFVLDQLRFDSRMTAARAVVTGEGRLDEQSLAGKVVSEVATRARQSGVPCHAIVGRLALDAFGLRILDLQAVLEAGTLPAIQRAARQLAELL